MTRSRIDSLRRLECEMAVLLRRIKGVIATHARAVHPELQPAAYLVLSWLTENGPARASSIVEHLDFDKSAVSRHLTHLGELGLIVRGPDPADGRATLISASEVAAERVSDAAAGLRRRRDHKLAEWPDETLAEFVDALGHYNRTLGSEL
ncbi:transcriptional regulator [Acrocarpospora phusangensis]|uniref:Transcriptional regulator n=1 Tax=Acrocarpospora phusangensis TaxID=1070424 RepID=A0A919QGP2_9ACTN|nr:MarR family transcriptional regulator [Acrocarpospora phusangensis]GIH28754.1 transcriptional regulator [Acrocarpospora phusangensis]